MAKTYDIYKDSGVAWIGEIPSRWKVGFVGRYFDEIKNPNTNQEETNTLPRYRVKHFLLFSVEILRRTSLTRRRACRCSVSVVAHYRELFRPDKRKI